MKVLHIFNEIKYSGAELMYANASSIFLKNNIQLLAFNTGKNLGEFVKTFEQNNIKTYHKPIDSGINITYKSFRFYKEFYKFLKSENIQVVHIHRSDIYMLPFVSRLAGVRTIRTVHSVFRNRKITYLHGYLQRLIARRFFNVIFHSIGKSVYDNELLYYHNPTIRINNWYNPQKFYPKSSEEEKEMTRKKLHIDLNAFVVISVGGCSEIKNHSDILRAISLLKDELNCLYLHLGSGDEEEHEKMLARDLGIQSKVKFIGNTENVRDYLISSDVYVMTSKFEGLTIAGIEAMACGLPSILYNSPGLRDLITNNDNGFLIEPDHKLIAEKICEYINSSKLLKEKSELSLQFVNQHFSMTKNVQKIIQLYENK